MKILSSKRASRQYFFDQNEKEYSYSRLISYFRFSDWVTEYSVKSSALTPPKRDKETFVDIGGTKRYADNWQPVEDKLSGSLTWEDFFVKTGCIKMSHLYEIYESIKEEAEGKEESIRRSNEDGEDQKIPRHLREYCYINEWQRLWIYMENDQRDELAEYAPLFRILIEFMFHPRMQRVMALMTVYDIILNMFLLPFFGDANTFSIFFLFFALILQAITYFAMVIVYRGTISLEIKSAVHSSNTNPQLTTAEKDEEKEKELEQNHVDILAYSLSTNSNNHFSFIRRELFSRLKREIYLLLCMPSSTRSTEPATYCCGCRESNQMMKWRRYQQKRSEMVRLHHQKRKLSYHELLNISLKFLIRVNGVNPDHINFDRWSYRVVLLFITIVYPIYVLVNGYIMTDITNLNVYCGGNFKQDNGYCGFFLFEFVLTGAQIFRFIPQVLFGASLMIALVSLAYGAEIVYQLVDAFLAKFRSIRRIEEYNIEELFDDVGSALPQSQEMQPVSSSTYSALHLDRNQKAIEIQTTQTAESPPIQSLVNDALEEDLSRNPLYSWVKRDAIEHYFFICEVFTASDKIWSVALAGIFFVAAAGMSIYISYVALVSPTPEVVIRLIIFLVVRALLLFVYPIASLCHANAAATELTSFFTKSSKEDFRLIGGCQEWVEFTTSCPATWTFMGLWITWDRLFGLMWTFLAAGLASGIATFFSTF